MEYLKDPIQWTREEQIEIASYVYTPQDLFVLRLIAGYDFGQVTVEDGYTVQWKKVFLFVPFNLLPLVPISNSFTKKCVEWRLQHGR